MDINIRDFIGFGKECAKTRKELIAETGLNDSKLRRLIRKSRLEENADDIIVCVSGLGYFRADDTKAIENFLKTEQAREQALHLSNANISVIINRLKVENIKVM